MEILSKLLFLSFSLITVRYELICIGTGRKPAKLSAAGNKFVDI